MKIKSKFLSVFLVICMAFMFAGCNLFGTNNPAYYNQNVIVATYDDGTKIEISRKDFLTVYNSYGQNLMSQYGQDEETARKNTVEALVNRKILLQEAKNLKISLSEPENKELYYQTYESLISNAKDYETAIREAWNKPKLDEITEDTSSEKTVYTKFEKQAIPVYDSEAKEYRIKLIKNDDLPTRSKTFNSLDDIYSEFIKETKNNSADEFAREEYRRYLASLQAQQKTLETNYTEEELFREEIKRIYNNLEENELITKYQEFKQENNNYSTITVDQVLNKYKAMISMGKFKYQNDMETYAKDMLENRKNVDYVMDNNFFYVAHILIKFSDEQQKEFDSLKELSNDGQGYVISAEQYEVQKTNLYNSIMASVRNEDTGEITSTDSIKVSDVLLEVQVALENASTKQAKDEAFRKLMYKYNEDPGIMNAEYPYVIGLNDSKMVESFTNTSRELHNVGEYGAVSGLVESEYGVHIIYYMGQCSNPYTIPVDGKINFRATYEVDGNITSDVLMLDETYMNGLHNKTIFDAVYESLVKDNYSQFENMNLNTIKQEKGIKVTVVKNLI